jgi:hypothetical protein
MERVTRQILDTIKNKHVYPIKILQYCINDIEPIHQLGVWRAPIILLLGGLVEWMA